jgi:uncharacterized membrane protein YeaQ/YmgE (transglycosylase-associated protein family)
MLILVLVLGALVGWAGGRVLALHRRVDVWGDIGAGVLGAVGMATGFRLLLVPAPDPLLLLLGGLLGALLATFVTRAHTDRYRHAVR